MNRRALMEAALARRLRNHRDFRQADLIVELLKEGGVRTSHHGQILGVWTWLDGRFELWRPLETGAPVRVATIHDAVVHLAMLLDSAELEL